MVNDAAVVVFFASLACFAVSVVIPSSSDMHKQLNRYAFLELVYFVGVTLLVIAAALALLSSWSVQQVLEFVFLGRN